MSGWNSSLLKEGQTEIKALPNGQPEQMGTRGHSRGLHVFVLLLEIEKLNEKKKKNLYSLTT